MSWKPNLLLSGATSLALGTGIYFVASARERDGLLDEILFETEEEQAVEEEIGVPLYLNWKDCGEMRSRRVQNFVEVYRETQEHWDFFDEQFSLVNRIRIRNAHRERLATAGQDGTITVYCGSTKCLEESTLVHELAHLWHYVLPEEFWDEWQALSGSGYYGDVREAKNHCLDFMESVAAVTCYGAKNEFEDIAELAAFVYELNDPTIFVMGFSDAAHWSGETLRIRWDYLELGLIPESIPRIAEKIRLLQRYGFFSAREMYTALHEVNEFYQMMIKESDPGALPETDAH